MSGLPPPPPPPNSAPTGKRPTTKRNTSLAVVAVILIVIIAVGGYSIALSSINNAKGPSSTNSIVYTSLTTNTVSTSSTFDSSNFVSSASSSSMSNFASTASSSSSTQLECGLEISSNTPYQIAVSSIYTVPNASTFLFLPNITVYVFEVQLSYTGTGSWLFDAENDFNLFTDASNAPAVSPSAVDVLTSTNASSSVNGMYTLRSGDCVQAKIEFQLNVNERISYLSYYAGNSTVQVTNLPVPTELSLASFKVTNSGSAASAMSEISAEVDCSNGFYASYLHGDGFCYYLPSSTLQLHLSESAQGQNQAITVKTVSLSSSNNGFVLSASDEAITLPPVPSGCSYFGQANSPLSENLTLQTPSSYYYGQLTFDVQSDFGGTTLNATVSGANSSEIRWSPTCIDEYTWTNQSSLTVPLTVSYTNYYTASGQSLNLTLLSVSSSSSGFTVASVQPSLPFSLYYNVKSGAFNSIVTLDIALKGNVDYNGTLSLNVATT